MACFCPVNGKKQWAAESDRYLFHIVAKHHMGWHMCLDSRHRNPRFSASWKGGDFVGKMSRLCHLCSFGTQSPPQVTRHASCAPQQRWQGLGSLHVALVRRDTRRRSMGGGAGFL